MARGFIGYFNEFFTAPAWLIMVVVLVMLTLIAMRGIAESARAAAALTLIEVGGLLWVIAVASPQLPALGALSLTEFLPLNGLAWQGVLGGAFLAFFAFIGFEDMVNIAEEVKQPQRTIPRGIVLAFIVSTVLYVLVALVSIATVPPASLATSDAPLAEVYRVATGHPAVYISLIGLVAVINGALIQIIMASRIFYGMSRNGWLPKYFGAVNPRTHTPIRATLIAGALTLLLALALPLISLAKATSAMVLVVFVLINLSLLRIKRHDPAPAGVRVLPLAVPLIGAVASALILVISVL
jgi:amino acid transporter